MPVHFYGIPQWQAIAACTKVIVWWSYRLLLQSFRRQSTATNIQNRRQFFRNHSICVYFLYFSSSSVYSVAFKQFIYSDYLHNNTHTERFPFAFQHDLYLYIWCALIWCDGYNHHRAYSTHSNATEFFWKCVYCFVTHSMRIFSLILRSVVDFYSFVGFSFSFIVSNNAFQWRLVTLVNQGHSINFFNHYLFQQ